MKFFKYTCITFLLIIISFSCNNNLNDTESTKVTGIIKELGITSFQYGTHTIGDYAIKSDIINLQDFVNKNVTIYGKKADGYPIDGGPILIIVSKVD